MTTVIEDARQEVIKLCWAKQKELGLDDERHKDRLLLEIKEIDTQMEHEYFYGLYKDRCKFAKNENNLFVAYLLGLVDDFDINQDPVYVQGEFPDIDVDYLPIVRDYLKNEWAPQQFGKDNVCAIGNYTTFGIKSALLDMARVHGKDFKEIQSITTKIGLKDEDGKALTWEKALEQYPEVKKYCEDNPDVADAASRLLNRNRGMGMHAGGLIISNTPIDTLVPLVRGKDGQHVSAFVEGLHGTDLGPLGLIKFDLLVITNLMQIALACRTIKSDGLSSYQVELAEGIKRLDSASTAIKKKYGLTSICALPGQSDWSDISYLNDPEALKLADEGKLKCIFQFDSDGIRELARRGGVNSFDDLVAYSALYRPGPMGMGMHDVYVKRKRGHEPYEIHPVLKPILGPTFGVMVFQEQVMKILRVVGNVPDMHCEIVRKAISKKKDKIFGRYKEMFLKNGQKVLNWTLAEVQNLWDQIAAFAEYGFNKSHSVAYTYISSRLLWLKAHYPLEFFTAVLSCEKDDSKIKEYKREVESMEIPINRVDLNKSKVKFSIVDDAIYMGFANIKGVGEEIAEKIVANQPYASFEDFLRRFGTEAKVVKPLIALRVFDGSPMALYEYYEYFKSEHKKITDGLKRAEESQKKFVIETEAILMGDRTELTSRDKWVLLFAENKGKGFTAKALREFEVDPKCVNFLEWARDFEDEETFTIEMKDVDCPWRLLDDEIEKLWKIAQKYKKSKATESKKNEMAIVAFEDFIPDGNVPPDVKELLCEVPQIAENEFYGFSWKHLLESSADYESGWTFSEFEDDETQFIRACEVHVIQKPKKKKSKKGNQYYTVQVEDANSRPEMITFWEDDYERFKEELEYWENDTRKGNFLRLRLKRPESGFKSYTFDSPSKQFRWKEIPKDKSQDHRMVVMARPTLLDEFEKVEATQHGELISVEKYEKMKAEGKIYEFGDNET